jgi:hypothetical protein
MSRRLLTCALFVVACNGGVTEPLRDGGARDGAAGGPAQKRLVSGRARLVGGPLSACSQPKGSADRWCAFTKPAAAPIGATELWVIDVTKAIAGTVACQQSNAACLKLTSALWTGTPDAGVVHPLAHHFDGENLIFYASAPVTAQAFNGPIFAWRPGWPEAKQLSGPNGYSCEGHSSADAALCIEDLHLDAMPPYFDVHAGRVNGAPLPLASRIYPTSSTGAKQWSIAFTPAGDSFAWSTGGPMPTDKETLYVSKVDEVGMDARRVTVGNVAEWDLSADGKHWFYLSDYNYPPRRSPVEPSGTLVVADFPGGGNPMTLATQVGSYVVLGDGSSSNGVAFLDHLASGKGTYQIVRDLARPTDIALVASGVLSAVVSPDRRFSLLQTQTGASAELSDAVIIKNDGTGGCQLSEGTSSMEFGAAFLPHSNRVLWADHVNAESLEGEGWLANPDGCGDKQKFGDLVDFWVIAGDRGIIFSDTATETTSTLRYLRLGPGGQLPPAGPSLIREQVGRVYAPLGADRDHVIFQVADGGPDDGIYAYGPLGF